MELHSRIVALAHVHLLHSVWLTNQQPKKLVGLLTISLARLAKARSDLLMNLVV